MQENIKIREKYGLTGKINTFASTNDTNKILRLSCKNLQESDNKSTNNHLIYDFCRKAFLPQGYPNSVSSDYFEYQFYDTIQAFCSRLTGTISTKSILKSVGVGNSQANVVSAAILWIFKDGVGLFSAILFAYLKGTQFDINCKKWRLFADVLNDVSMFLDLFMPYLAGNLIFFICLSTCMKSLVGVAGSATRAAVIQHQSKIGNAADVTAKDGSQETAVNLVASIVGIFLLNFIEDSNYEMSLFILFCCLHMFANFWAVKSLIFKSLNNERFIIICKNYIIFDNIPNLLSVNRKESVFLWSGNTDVKFCGFKINVGITANSCVNLFSKEDLIKIMKIYKEKEYLLIPNYKNKKLNILLTNNASNSTILKSYFHALIFGISYNICNDLNLDFCKKTTLKNSNLLKRLKSKIYDSKIENNIELLKIINDFVDLEYSQFISDLEKKDWDTTTHSITTEDWRIENFDFF